MKAAPKEKRDSSQKGFSLVAIVLTVIAIVAILLVVTMYLPKNSQNPTSTNNQTSQSQSLSDKYNKYESDKFVVYTPKNLKKSTDIIGYVVFRESPNDRDGINGISVSEVFEAKQLPYKAGLEEDVLTSDTECKQIKPFASNYKLQLIEGKYVEYKTYKGCMNSYTTETKYNVIYYIVYEKPVPDTKTSIFQVKAYYDSTDTKLAEDMKEAVSLFSPKSQ